MFGSYLGGNSSTEWLTEDLNARCLWKLSLEEENNSLLREEFFYEQVAFFNELQSSIFRKEIAWFFKPFLGGSWVQSSRRW